MNDNHFSDLVAIIIPAYNEAENIKNTARVLSETVTGAGINALLLFVDDGSTDDTWREIAEVAETSAEMSKDARARAVCGIRFSRNFGKEAAIFAGLDAARKARCGAAVVIDCDLQHPPETIVQMVEKWREGYDVVEGVKISRGRESAVYKLFAKTFYKIFHKSAGINLDGASDFKLLDKKVLDALSDMPERLTFFRAMSGWVGFKTARVGFEVRERAAGVTKWSSRALLTFAAGSITGFTSLPMQFMTAAGGIFMVFAVVMAINTVVNYFNGAAAGFSTVILLILISGGLIMLGLGIIGYYLSKIYEEIKARPRYIIADKISAKSE